MWVWDGQKMWDGEMERREGVQAPAVTLAKKNIHSGFIRDSFGIQSGFNRDGLRFTNILAYGLILLKCFTNILPLAWICH